VLRRALLVAAATLLLAGRSQATVYSWRDASGVFHFTNREDEVPAGPLDSYRAVEERPAPRAEPAASAPPAEPDATAAQSYAQGIDDGLRLAAEQEQRERELAAAEEPPPVYFEPQPAPPVYVSVVPADDPGYGVVDSCAYGGCWPWLGGPVFYTGPFVDQHRFHGGRGAHRGRFGNGHGMSGGGGRGGRGFNRGGAGRR
jgi:hypothetical protein